MTMTPVFLSSTSTEWLKPVTEQAPCGPNLEYDADYARLMSLLQPRGEVQYGEFIGNSEPPDWGEIERLCRNLLSRTHDINVLVWLCRARVRTASAHGLAQCLEILAEVLERWPRDVHPQAWIDGAPDPVLRANALAALCDPEGLLDDIRDIVISGNAMRLIVRDVERAFSAARGNDPAASAAVRQQLDHLRIQTHGDSSTATWLLGRAACSAQRIQQWCAQQLKGDAPDLTPLLRVLRPYEPMSDPVINLAENTQAEATAISTGGHPPDAYPPRPDQEGAKSRDIVLQDIRAARRWFEANEPSSPVVVLLKQAERMVGLRFSALADAIPLELVRKWDAQSQDATSAHEGTQTL